MREPNFSEFQLQQAINSAYIRHVFETEGDWMFAHVPSLIDEHDLGWDSAFYFPWLRHLPHSYHNGCNFFIQYKLSGQLTSSGAKEWECWNEEYFRFKIPHSTKDAAGKFFDDYHQWDCLKKLANQRYPTFYATNSTLSKDELQKSTKAGTLLDETPLLDVRSVKARHKHVTFTNTSESFLLHSDVEEAPQKPFRNLFSTLLEEGSISFEKSTKDIFDSLSEMDGNNEEWHNDLSRIANAPRAVPRDLQTWRKYVLLISFVRKHIGAELLWYPDNR
ncbi:hypothetical protein [Paraburkholderia silvatlantica]|uniref:hypothetical protein n=1 Tax=Paraburkholderia silvatlantica TaxID=321895 RepID=UPI00105C6FC1|nr:hypothetical protein [Paraburkholderia silvatlantica]TDQ75489.1 hypothetical protein C7412_1426 [Paraburkholderia silvatlantica]